MDVRQALMVSTVMGRSCDGLKAKVKIASEQNFIAIVQGHDEPHVCQFKHDGDNDGRWHCDCEDFRFTFWPAIDKLGNTLWPVRHYEPKGTGKPRAIDEVGMCKHIMCLVQHLKDKGKI